MKVGQLLLVACLAVVNSQQAIATEERSQGSRPPNIVLVIGDDMHKSMFNRLPEAAGKNRNLTPTLDQLQDQGVMMMQQHVSSPICNPSRYSLMTGKYASCASNWSFINRAMTEYVDVTQIAFNTYVVAGEPSLPSYMKTAGFTTGYVGKNHVFETKGVQRVARNRSALDPGVTGTLVENQERLRSALRAAGFDYAERLYLNNPNANGPAALSVHNLDWITEGAIEFIDRYKDEPFFLVYSATVPHVPVQPEMSWKADPLATPVGFLDQAPRVQPARPTLQSRIDEAGISRRTKWWGPENLLWLDDAIGAIMRRLHHHGIDDDTIVIFFNDHGPEAKGSTYQGGVHSPSIIWRKGGWAVGNESQAMVSNVDLAPTILEMAGVSVDKEAFDGRSFLPALQGEDFIDKPLLFELGYSRAIRSGNWKYIAVRYPEAALQMTATERRQRLEHRNAMRERLGDTPHNSDPAAPFSHLELVPGGGGAEWRTMEKYPAFHDRDQLYNLAEGPSEQHNLADDPDFAPVLESMQTQLRELLSTTPANFAEFTQRP